MIGKREGWRRSRVYDRFWGRTKKLWELRGEMGIGLIRGRKIESLCGLHEWGFIKGSNMRDFHVVYLVTQYKIFYLVIFNKIQFKGVRALMNRSKNTSLLNSMTNGIFARISSRKLSHNKTEMT